MRITVISNEEKDIQFYYTKLVINQLLKLKANVSAPAVNAEKIGIDQVKYADDSDIYRNADIVVALGGDGTILHAAKTASLFEIPVLGINTGRLGFMAGLEVNELDRLNKLITGDYEVDKRMMLEIRVDHRNEVYYALNDAVVSKGVLSRIIDIKVSSSGREVGNYRADGMIVSTPTGSTAYALSAGGPVIDPQIESIGITPICTHSLISRTILFEPKSKLCLCPMKLKGKEAYLIVDGQDNISLKEGDRVNISKASLQTFLIRLKDISFYQVLNNKLNERGI